MTTDLTEADTYDVASDASDDAQDGSVQATDQEVSTSPDTALLMRTQNVRLEDTDTQPSATPEPSDGDGEKADVVDCDLPAYVTLQLLHPLQHDSVSCGVHCVAQAYSIVCRSNEFQE